MTQPGELTPTEQKVARCIAECATNRQIAAALRISERQVESHVAGIVDAWQLDRHLNLRAQIVRRYSETFGFPRLGA